MRLDTLDMGQNRSHSSHTKDSRQIPRRMPRAHPKGYRPIIKPGWIVTNRRVDIHVNATIAVAAVIVFIGTAVVIVAAPREVMPVEAVRPLDISWTSPLGDKSRMISALNRHSLATVQSMMDVHAALGIVHVAQLAVRATLECAAAFQLMLLGTFGAGAP